MKDKLPPIQPIELWIDSHLLNECADFLLNFDAQLNGWIFMDALKVFCDNKKKEYQIPIVSNVNKPMPLNHIQIVAIFNEIENLERQFIKIVVTESGTISIFCYLTLKPQDNG